MKRLNRFFTILFAVLGVQIASAQTDVTDTYLTNADFSSLDGWNTYASSGYRDLGFGKIGTYRVRTDVGAVATVDATHLNTEYCFGVECRWANNYASFYQETKIALTPGVYTLSYDVENTNANTTAASYNNLFNVKVGTSTYTDPDNEWAKGGSSWTTHSITFVIAEESKATISLGYGTGSNNIGSANTPVLHISHLKLIYRSLDDISSENTADLTSYINNHSFETGDMTGWTSAASSDTGVKPNSNGTYTTSGVHGNYLYNTWWQGTPLTQTITNLPNGIYVFNVLVASGDGSGTTPDMYLIANGEHSEVYTISDGDKGKFHDISYEFKVLNGQATIGVVGGNDDGTYNENGHWWYKADNFRLTYKGADLSLLQEAFSQSYSELEKLSTNNIPTAFAQEISNLLNTYRDVPASKKELQVANESISSVVSKHSGIVTSYSLLQSLISLCTEYTDTKNSNANSETILTNFQTAISTATTSGDAALNVDEINNAYNNLESARQIYAQNAVPVYPYPFDMTFLIGNATFDSNIDGWTKSGGAGWMNAGNVECYNNTFTFSKSLTGLGSGSWEVSVDGFYRYGGYNNAESAHNGGTEVLNVKFYANANEVALMSIMEGAGKAGDVGATTAGGVRVPNGPAEGNIYFAAGCYKNTVATIVTDGNLNIGLKKETTQGSDWTLFDNFKLVYKGIDVSELQASLTALIEKAEGVKSSVMGKAEETNLTNAINAADATVTVADDLNEMISDLQSAYDAAVISIDTYSKVPAYISKANKIDASIAETYQANYDNRTLVGDAETIRQELNVATFKYVEDNFKNEIALTEWGAESNAMWSESGEHWDGTSGEGCTSYYDANGTNTTHTLSKEVELTPGTYVFRAAGRSNSNTELSLSISIDGVDPVIFNAKGNTGRGIDKTGNATFADDAEYARDGQGQGWEWEFIKFTLNEKTTVTLTATSKTTGWGWASFANNGLWMDDATYLIANASALEKPMATAQELLDQPMNVEKKTALQEATNLPANTVTEFNAKIASLETAIDEAKISIEEYKEILTYINKANSINESIAASYQTQYNEGTVEGSAEDVFQALEVATYNYVTSNFTYDVALSDTWNSTGTNTRAATFSDEHWSGEAREYKNQYDDWGDNKQGYPANSWSIDFDQDVTLPAGEYVFKVAGRKSVDATLELVVTKGETTLGTVNDFPSSNNSLGINKAGAASFDAEDQAGFANNGSGFGWQWRYVKFTLTEKSTVKVAVHAETDKVNNWVSFGNYTLQMTEETYMAAGQPELDAALVAAQALVGTKPMGTDEEKALNDAIELPVTTGAEQKAKVNALKAAVANANTWRTTYYAEKDKLVAQLERFETDYNDAENGSLDYMNKNRWTTVIEKAQAAAVAKDNQTSHTVLTTATNELKAALDAATVSVKEYGDLKSAITEANALVVANVGDQPFEKPQSAADAINTTDEQALYDAATADGEGVTSVTDALTKGIATFNNTSLNAPKEGQRFFVKVATEGHSKLGNAVLAVLGATGGNNPTGYGLNCNNPVKGYLNQAFTFTQVEGNLYNISIERTEGTVYLTYGSLNGSAAGWKNQQIQATTDDAKKGEFKIEATTKEGVLKILNTIDNNYLDCQDGGSIYTDTGIQSEEFNFELASEHTITLTISSAKWSTLILPFNAELPEGVKAYTCAGVIDGVLTFNEATTIKANTPYLVGGNAGKYDFSGYGLADKDVYTVGESPADGQFTGTYVDYQTSANDGTWILQHDKNTGTVAFFIVGESAQPWVRANRCYITYDSASEARVLRLGFDDTSSIDNVLFPTDNSELTIYDTMGRKVKSMKKGSLYIINGKKVVVK